MYFNRKPSTTTIYRVIAIITLITTIYSCANMSRPSGGPYDETPPVFLHATPAPGALNVSKQKMEIVFDEIVQVDKVTEKVVVSPPQKDMPEIRASGHKIHINLKDSLLPNTTYTVDFSDAVVDNNERNPLYNFSYSFSTGEVFDSLQISGILLEASNLEPVTGMLVGIYSNLDDTAFQKLPLERIARSDALGRFTIRNLAPGKYRLVALGDVDRDYRFANLSENIAFHDSIIEPWYEVKLHTDTLWRDSLSVDGVIIDNLPTDSLAADSLTIDTIIQYNRTHFFPNDILLSVFNEGFQNQYLDKSERKERRRLDLYFKAPADSLPRLTPLNFEQDDWAVLERSLHNDTLMYWIKDSTVYNMDTLLFAANYLRTDTLQQLSAYDDTLKFIMKVPKKKKNEPEVRKKEKEEEGDSIKTPQIEFLKMTANHSATLDVYRPLSYTFNEPIAHYDSAMIHLEQKRDTLWIPIADSLYNFRQDSVALRNYTLSYKWAPGESYRVVMDSTAFTNIYGLFTDKYKQEFKIKSLEEYANLYLAITGIADSAIVELLNASDTPIRQAPVRNGGAEFMYLAPGTYYARIFIDANGNGKYDTGNYAEKRQPEEVSYYPNELELKANWDVEQEWDIYATPVDKQKPEKIKKNKPKERQRNRRDRR